MCGIFAFNGKNYVASERILKGINEILYRGYDSIGIALDIDNKINVFKKAHCEIENINELIGEEKSKRGIGHNRWATVGEVSDNNAHPHWDYRKEFFVVHNGNVENFFDLKNNLQKYYKLDQEIEFHSSTDTELIANLISFEYCGNLEKTIARVMSRIQGANAIVVMTEKHPDIICGAKVGSPLLVCKNGDCVMLASDAQAFINEESKEIPKYVALDDGEIVTIKNDRFSVRKEGIIITKEERELTDAQEYSGLGNFSFFMEKEIFDQITILKNVFSGRLLFDQGISKLGGLEEHARALSRVKTFHFIGCGTAYNACCYAKLLFNRFGVAANVWIASEFCSCHPVYDNDDAFIFISQSGETADTIEALKEVKNIKHKLCIGIVNKQATQIPRMTDAGIHVRAGAEKGVASTKAYTAQLVCIILLAVFIARQRNMTLDTGKKILEELQTIPEKVANVLSQSLYIKSLAIKYSKYHNFYFLGRYFNYITAMEGALKLKEISYVHAEAYPLGEMKHGPLALVDEDFVNFVIVPNDSVFEKSMMNISEARARKGKVITVSTDDLNKINNADDVIFVPKTLEFLQNIITTIPTQLFAYYIALELGRNPDKPRNLAKSVTVS